MIVVDTSAVVADKRATSVYVLSRGHSVLSGPPSVATEEALQRVYSS